MDCDEKNLLAETIQAMYWRNYTSADVVFVGSSDGEYECTWDEFAILADEVYGPTFGSQEVAADLVVAFADGTWLARGAYDGSEWWEYHKPPKPQAHPKKIERLLRDEDHYYAYEGIAALHAEEEE